MAENVDLDEEDELRAAVGLPPCERRERQQHEHEQPPQQQEQRAQHTRENPLADDVTAEDLAARPKQTDSYLLNTPIAALLAAAGYDAAAQAECFRTQGTRGEAACGTSARGCSSHAGAHTGDAITKAEARRGGAGGGGNSGGRVMPQRGRLRAACVEYRAWPCGL